MIVADIARKHGTTRWQIYDWRKQIRKGNLVVSESVAALPMFAELVIEDREPDVLERGGNSGIEIVVGDVVIRAGTGADEGQLTRAFRAARTTTSSCLFRVGQDRSSWRRGLLISASASMAWRWRCRRCSDTIRFAGRSLCSGLNARTGSRCWSGIKPGWCWFTSDWRTASSYGQEPYAALHAVCARQPVPSSTKAAGMRTSPSENRETATVAVQNC